MAKGYNIAQGYKCVTWHLKGNALLGQGKYDEAVKAFDKAIKIDRQYVDALNKKGSALNHLGKYDDAIKCYDEVITQKQDNQMAAFAYYEKSGILKVLGKTTEADAAFAKAKELGYSG